MASRPWTADELALIERHIQNPRWHEALAPAINRSKSAMVRKRWEMRAKLGLGDGRHERSGEDESWGSKAFMAKMERAAAELRDATLRVGVWA